MAKLLCAGVSCVDLLCSNVDPVIFQIDAVYIDRLKTSIGGDATNAAVNLSKLGFGRSVRYVGSIADDLFGRYFRDTMQSWGIDTRGLYVKENSSTMTSIVLINSDGERHFVVYGNANNLLSVEDVLAFIEPDTEYLHLGSLMALNGLEEEHLEELFRYAKEHHIHTSFDVTYDRSGKWFDRIRAGLPYTDIFFASYEEAVVLSGGKSDPEDLAAYFGSFGVRKFVLKLGSDGCFATDYQTVVRKPAYQGISVADTTGAGDAFVSAYLYGQMHGFSMEDCCILGNASGAMAVGAVGSTAGTGSLSDLISFLKTHEPDSPQLTSLIDRLKQTSENGLSFRQPSEFKS